MKQSAIAKKLGISIRSLQAMSAAELAAYGWEKIGKGKGTYYKRLNQDLSEESERESMEEAKRRKMIADANLAELKADARIKEIKKEGVNETIDLLMDCIKGAAETIRESGLSPVQNKIINEAFADAIERFGNLRRTLE